MDPFPYRLTIVALCSGLLLGACGGPTYRAAAEPDYSRYSANRVEYGYVESIDLYRTDGGPPVGVGALLGGIAGGVIGHQIGSGRGNTAATIAGAIGGAVVGNEVERSNRVEGSRYRVGIRLDSGARIAIEDARAAELRVGDRVRVDNGTISRV